MADPKKIAVFDIDGTVFRWQLFHEVIIRLADNGYFPKAQSHNLNKHYHSWQSRSEEYNNFSHTSIDVFEKNLINIPPDVMCRISEEIVADSGHKVYRYTTSLARKLHNEGYTTLALSGSMQEIVTPFANKYGFDDAIGELYEQKDGRYTGKMSRKVVGVKAQLIQDYATKNNLSLEGSYAVGDSDGDIDMLDLVTNPIAFNPSEELLIVAKERGWTIAVERKNIIYDIRQENGIFVLAEAKSL